MASTPDAAATPLFHETQHWRAWPKRFEQERSNYDFATLSFPKETKVVEGKKTSGPSTEFSSDGGGFG